jgi:hypothetical protein
VWRKWLPAETWAEILTLSGLVDESVCRVDATMLNAAMIRSKQFFDGPAMDRFDGTNPTGIFRVRFQKKFYYMLTDPFEQADYPCPLDIKWKDSVISVAMEVMSAIVITRSSVSSLFSVMTLKDKLPTAVTQDKSSQPSKGDTILHFYETSASTRSVLESITTMRPAGASSPNSTSSSDCHQQQDKEEERHEGMPCIFVRDDASAFHIQASTLCFWNSRDAWNLFAGGGSTSFEEFSADIGGGNNVLDILEGHVVALQSASKTLNGWRDVVQGRDAENVCSKSDIFVVLKSRAIILCLAYQTAMRHMKLE